MIFELQNSGKAARGFYNTNQRVFLVEPDGKPVRADLSEQVACDIRRLEMRGDSIAIKATDDRGDYVLRHTVPKGARKFGLTGAGVSGVAAGDALVEMLNLTPGENIVRDELHGHEPAVELPSVEDAPVGDATLANDAEVDADAAEDVEVDDALPRRGRPDRRPGPAKKSTVRARERVRRRR